MEVIILTNGKNVSPAALERAGRQTVYHDTHGVVMVIEYEDENNYIPSPYEVGVGHIYEYVLVERFNACAHHHPVVGVPRKNEHTQISVWAARPVRR